VTKNAYKIIAHLYKIRNNQFNPVGYTQAFPWLTLKSKIIMGKLSHLLLLILHRS